MPGAQGQVNNQCDMPGEAPDLVVAEIYGGPYRWGTVGEITAYTLGTEICNLGSCWLNFFGLNANHPVLGQNLFRLRNGRFEQIGQSWIKHPHGVFQDPGCSNSCLPAPNSSHLGVNCSDIYNSDINGGQASLGPKYEINPYTGVIVFPFTTRGVLGNAIYKRLQVHNADLDPSQAGGGLYFLEAQYIGKDEVAGGNAGNDCSYQRATVHVVAGEFQIVPDGPTVVGSAAIQAWRSLDPAVTETSVVLPSNGTYILASRAIFLGSGQWRYEYAIQNVNASRGAASFSVPIPSGTQVTNIGFHDVDYHSGDGHDGTDWIGVAGDGSVSWEAFAGEDLNLNTLGWGTLYNFRFDADRAPGSHSVTLGRFEQHAGDPVLTSVQGSAVAPSLCDGDGICDPGEDCATCPGDCAAQGGNSGCCGDAQCAAGETATTCFLDCGVPSEHEGLCGDSVDNDRDGSVDCLDPDCCADSGCGVFDADGDLRTAHCDCDDANPGAWATPGDIGYLTFAGDDPRGPTLFWSIPDGGVSHYDVLRSSDPADFVTNATCLESVYLNTATDLENPPPGTVYAYLVRGVNACPNGVGSLGSDSEGAPRTGRSCP